MIVRGDRVLANEESNVSETLQSALQRDGIQLHFNVNTEKAIYADDVFTLKLDNSQELQGEALLIATGRKPNTSALNVAATGVELDEEGYIKIDVSIPPMAKPYPVWRGCSLDDVIVFRS
jgi:dihydrolipoamide dehydrogenase